MRCNCKPCIHLRMIMCESFSRSVVSDSLRLHGLQPGNLLSPWNSPGKNLGVGRHSLLQGIFPTWGLNPDLPRSPALQQILDRLSHQGIVFHCMCAPYLYPFFFSAIVSSAAMNMGGQVSLCDCDLTSLTYTKKWDLDHIVVVFLIFEGLSYCFPECYA